MARHVYGTSRERDPSTYPASASPFCFPPVMTTPATPSPKPRTSIPPAMTTPVPPYPDPPARVYMIMRIRDGREPNAKGQYTFNDLSYYLAVDDGVRSTLIPLPLHGISTEDAMKLRWVEVSMCTPTIGQMSLPSNKLHLVRDLAMLFYLFWTQEEGFSWDLYDDVCAAIARYADYAVPVPPLDRTSLLKALLEYVKPIVGDPWFKPQRYTPGELAVAEELFHGERKWKEWNVRWPTLTLAELSIRSQGDHVPAAWYDRRHSFPINLDFHTLPTMCPILDDEVWDIYLTMAEP